MSIDSTNNLNADPLARASARGTRLARGQHSLATLALHWGSLLAIIVAVAAIYVREFIEQPSQRILLMSLHRQLGLLVLLGVGARLAVRYTIGFADHTSRMGWFTRSLAWLTHLALYLLLLAIPMLGWAASNAHEISVNLFGFVPLPDLVNADSDLSDTLDDYHKFAAWGLGTLVALHALAGLWHHYVRRDAVLAAMLPGRRTDRLTVRERPHHQ